jgi:DNA (cytosine-5)-methyltransferase 1
MNLVAVSLFSGAGGLDLGFIRQGFFVPVAIEFDRCAAYTYAKNFGCRVITTETDLSIIRRGEAVVVWDDIRKVTGSFIQNLCEKIAGTQEIDTLLGGPSCQSWSSAGNRLGVEDARGQMIFEYYRLLTDLSPASFVFENVKGMVSKKFYPIFASLVRAFTELGYNVNHDILCSSDFGVPQNRERLFVVATKRGLRAFAYPAPQPKRPSLREAVANLPLPTIFSAQDARYHVPVCIKGLHDRNRSEFNNEPISNHFYRPYAPPKADLLKMIPEGGNWRQLPDELARNYLGKAYHSGGGRTGFLRKLSWDKPAPTILASMEQKATEFCMPIMPPRRMTVRESLRLQGFTDDFIVYGSLNDQYRQVGNAVSVPVAEALARNVICCLEGGEGYRACC